MQPQIMSAMITMRMLSRQSLFLRRLRFSNMDPPASSHLRATCCSSSLSRESRTQEKNGSMIPSLSKRDLCPIEHTEIGRMGRTQQRIGVIMLSSGGGWCTEAELEHNAGGAL